MIGEEELNKCIDKLATINASTNDSHIKKLTVEIGYILRNELDNVQKWNAQFDGKSIPKLDVQKLMQDNTQLAHENVQLQQINLKFAKVIDQTIPNLENTLITLNKKVAKIIQFTNSL